MGQFIRTLLPAVMLLACVGSRAQITERPRPSEWDSLVRGARFIDRFLPMPAGTLSYDTWGAEGVVPRYVDNGIENREWSFWGGNILRGKDGKYHLFVCGWREDSPRGHNEWPDSFVFNAVSDNTAGPFTVTDTIGRGHNPEAFRLADGRYVIYVVDRYYISDSIDGPWSDSRFEFDPRDRRIIEGLSNLTFAKREDGSYLMICRGGGVWISETGISPYRQLTDSRVYPPVAGEFEDPVVWKDNVQYHLIVNDWLGRIAFYLRSKDGVNWVTDPGEAYMPGIAVHEDGRKEDWFKYERIKVFQDEYGRAVQANFAVIDVLKAEDRGSDNHSSKNISIPLNPGLLLAILDDEPITARTKEIRVRISAEEGFDPHKDIDLGSLRFGASEEVNYGRGSKVLKTRKEGRDLIVTFDGAGSGIGSDEFSPKLIGRTKRGALLYGYARLPYVDYIEPVLSARAPVFTASDDGFGIGVEVQNFGQAASGGAILKIEYDDGGTLETIAAAPIPPLQPYAGTIIPLSCGDIFEKGREYPVIVTIEPERGKVSKLHVNVTPD